ncbi:type I restriction enzyme S subunit [Haloarcula quadrata]|uniref:Type I restriction enzyme S subunit n=1 Tax=Haloarcula quadrata TaxID=182779 RepID=A0A495R329_9EURY|nr:restriction endonuclease subunit S [Haloarcula quadrata]RKS81524.1 type I restriction enzyme S subunit [Haloarcula quadrata]
MSEEATLDDFTETAGEAESGEESEQELFGLGKIPIDWSIESLADIAEIIPGNSPPSSTYNEKGEGLPFFQGNSEFGHFHPVADTWCSEPRKEAAKNDVLMSIRAPVGDLNIADRNCCIGRGLAALRPKSLNGLYLFYNLAERKPWLSRLATGSTFKSVTKSDLQLLDIPVPSLQEQRKIATVIHNVDRAIQKTENIESQIRQTKKGIVQDVLERGLGASETSDTGTKLGSIPTHWEVTTIENIVADEENAFTDGARYSLSSAEIHDEGEARAILLQEVGEGEFNDEDPKFATEEKYEEITHRAIYPGEVVVAKMAEPVARACIVPEKYDKYLLGCADVVRVQTNEEFDERFLMYCMNSHKVWRQAVAHLRGTGRSRINLENIAELKLPKPPLKEQVEIADTLEKFDQRVENEQDYRDRLQRLKQSLMQDLLSGTVRTTDTNIEVPDEIAQHG